ncbi:MAG: nucleotidyltransferase family protein [Sphingobium sp.]|nr:MAG: nucleotidyltransferase family protein [Sphingobium sp.]
MKPADTTGVLLAAGLSRRFGLADKLVAIHKGRPLIAHAAEALAAIRPRHLIGIVRPLDDAPVVHAILTELGFTLLVNDQPEAGLSGSIARAMDQVMKTGCSGALIVLADMPGVTAGHLCGICDKATDDRSIVASLDGKSPSPPCLFGRAHFSALGALQGDKGARDLLSGASLVPAAPGMLGDVDTPEDLHGFDG